MFDAIQLAMKALPKILLALTGVAALSLAYPASLQAVPTTYVYTGNPFTTAPPLHHERLRVGYVDIGEPAVSEHAADHRNAHPVFIFRWSSDNHEPQRCILFILVCNRSNR